jgi:hypothetical protein
MDIIGQNGNTGEHYEDTNDDINWWARPVYAYRYG